MNPFMQLKWKMKSFYKNTCNYGIIHHSTIHKVSRTKWLAHTMGPIDKCVLPSSIQLSHYAVCIWLLVVLIILWCFHLFIPKTSLYFDVHNLLVDVIRSTKIFSVLRNEWMENGSKMCCCNETHQFWIHHCLLSAFLRYNKLNP